MRNLSSYACLAILLCAGAQAQSLSPDQILTRAAATASWSDAPCSYSSHVHWTKDFGHVEQADIVARHFVADHGRSRLESQLDVSRNDVRNQPAISTWISVVTSDRYAFFPLPQNGQKTVVHFGQTPAAVDHWRKGLESDLNSGLFLDGRIDGRGSTAFDLARLPGVTLQSASDNVDGIDCTRLECDLPDHPAFPLEHGQGHLKLWFAPSQDFALIAFEVEEQGIADRGAADYKIRFDHARIKTIDKHPVVTGGHWRATLIQNGERPQTTIADAERTDVRFSPKPDDGNLFTFDKIPDGSRVMVDGDVRHYVWQAGKPVPALEIDLPRMLPHK